MSQAGYTPAADEPLETRHVLVQDQPASQASHRLVVKYYGTALYSAAGAAISSKKLEEGSSYRESSVASSSGFLYSSY